jgi:NAD(P)-dependent dehydrogenase (short-subunit alcohol dehydrogenase family)
VAELDQKTALVTGGGTGIGAGIALALAREGCRVVINGRREDKLRETAARFSGQPPLVIRPADVSVRSEAQRLVEWTTQQLGRIDILVNAAGINIVNRTMAALDPADWDRLMQVNATSAYNTMHFTLPQMRDRQDGLIVNIVSIAGLRASPLGGVAYSASKFAMASLGTCVALEEKDHGIRVTNIHPGEVETPILDARPVPVTKEHRARILQPDDVAAAVLMVCRLPPRAHVPDLVIKPTSQAFA